MSAFSSFVDKGITGLANLGNTCFINSTLQCLSHSYELSTFLNTKKYESKITQKPDSLILVEYDKLRDMMWSENCIISPGGFITAVQKVAAIKQKQLFTGFAQNDLPEFLNFIIDCFHTSIMREVDMKIKGNVITDKDQLASKCYQMMQKMYKEEYSDFLNMFYGISVSNILSLKSHEIITSTPEPYNIISLPIPKMNTVTLFDCFKLYTEREKMIGENSYFNEKKNKKEDALKEIKFWSLPNILIIDLKRFTNSNQKNNKFVSFPLDNFDLSKFVLGYDRKSYIYDLYGICNHTGGVMGGHYTAYVKTANNKWWHFNDTHTNEISDIKKLQSNNAYCFFYRKKAKK